MRPDSPPRSDVWDGRTGVGLKTKKSRFRVGGIQNFIEVNEVALTAQITI